MRIPHQYRYYVEILSMRDTGVKTSGLGPSGTITCETIPCGTIPCETIPCGTESRTSQAVGMPSLGVGGGSIAQPCGKEGQSIS
jgi:hypothetical protein